MREVKRIEISPKLIRQAQAGDQEAFAELYRQSGPTVYRTIYSMVQDEDAAWDIHQNTYLLAWQGLAKLEKPEAFLPWLRQIAVHEAIKELKKDQPLCFAELTDAEEEEPQFAETRDSYQPELSLDRQEAARLVRAILDQLPQKQRLIMGMYYYEGFSVKEIAEALNVTQGTVKTQLHLGRKRVELQVKRLEGEGVKLYGLSPTAFLVALLKRQPLPVRDAEAALAETLAKAGVSTGAKAAAAGASGAAAEAVVLHAARPFYTTVIGKIVLGMVAVGVVVGGAAGFRWAKDKLLEKRSSIPYESTGEALPTFPVEPAPVEPKFSELSGDDEHKAWGRCGENLTWTLNKDTGELTIEGSGAMDDYPRGLGDVFAITAPWAYYVDIVTAVRLPEELTYIGKSAFLCCSDLTEVDPLPAGLTGIGAGAFRGCKSLKGIEFPEGLTTIEKQAFCGCASLKIIKFPESLTRIEREAFAFCESLKTVNFPKNLTMIGDGAFMYNESLTGIILPEDLEVIESYAFYASGLTTNLFIPASIKRIGTGAFAECPLSGINVASDNSYYSSLDGVLYNKAQSELIQYPAGSWDTSFTVPMGVTNIGPYAFALCLRLKSIILPVGLTSIADSAFRGCINLTSQKFPEGLTRIGNSAFHSCINLTSIKLPEGLTGIGNSAFSYCTSLTSIALPEASPALGILRFRSAPI